MPNKLVSSVQNLESSLETYLSVFNSNEQLYYDRGFSFKSKISIDGSDLDLASNLKLKFDFYVKSVYDLIEDDVATIIDRVTFYNDNLLDFKVLSSEPH